MRNLVVAVLLVGGLVGCSTRSISNSGYDRGYYGAAADNPFYQGELSEFDVLGIATSDSYDQTRIAARLAQTKRSPSLTKGDAVLLIQSGAMLPDQDMLDQLTPSFRVIPFSGVPDKRDDKKSGYASSLRYAAAGAGVETIVVYWGILEAGSENLGTKTVSWIPIVGAVVPDENQLMRIRLKVCVIDVESGAWDIFTPEALTDSALSAVLNRGQSDQRQVARLKEQAYAAASHDLLLRYEH